MQESKTKFCEESNRWFLQKVKNHVRGKCSVVGCGNVIRESQNGSVRKVCASCRKMILKLNNPSWAAWYNLKARAKRRRIGFRLTKTEFDLFLTLKPTTCEDWTVDRIDPKVGYTLTNMQWLTRSENSRKGATIDKRTLQQIEYADRLFREVNRNEFDLDDDNESF